MAPAHFLGLQGSDQASYAGDYCHALHCARQGATGVPRGLLLRQGPVHLALSSARSSFEETQPAGEDLGKYAGENSASLHGTTANGEVCKCVSGNLEAPRTQKELGNLFHRDEDISRQVAHQKYLEETKESVEALRPRLEELGQAKDKHDASLAALQEKASAVDAAASAMSEALKQVKHAYSYSNCAEAAKHAEEDNAPTPQCEQGFKEAIQQFEACRAKAQPSCKVGAATLLALREYAGPDPQVAAVLPLAPWALQRRRAEAAKGSRCGPRCPRGQARQEPRAQRAARAGSAFL